MGWGTGFAGSGGSGVFVVDGFVVVE